MRKTKQIKRKEIIFEPDEWARIEADAAKLNLKTSAYIRRMVLQGQIIHIDVSDIMPDVSRLAAQLAVINREGIRSIGEVEGKAEAYRAECRRIAGEIEKLDKSSADAEKRLSVLQNQYEKTKQHFDVYSDIVQTYRTISQGDYISRLIDEERKRQAVVKSHRKKNVSL